MGLLRIPGLAVLSSLVLDSGCHLVRSHSLPFLSRASFRQVVVNLKEPHSDHDLLDLRGGNSNEVNTPFHPKPPPPPPPLDETDQTDATGEPSLDDKVYAAMKKLGVSPPSGLDSKDVDTTDCKDGVCPMPTQKVSTIPPPPPADLDDLAQRIAEDLKVDSRLAVAAMEATATLEDGQREYNEAAARRLIQQELDLIQSIPTDSSNVQALVQEGYDPFLSRRALAFAENNMDDARAILVADQMDEESPTQANTTPPVVEVNTNFDPTKLPATKTTPPKKPAMPKAAPKESVVFEATTAQIQELVLESPVPVLLDIHADWCGPCKVLGPALEDIAVKAGGLFRLVKVNSDNEQPVSNALGVTALPTVYGVKDGRIVHMFQGMPKSEEALRNFMMGLFGAASFQPPVTAQESQKYEALTLQLAKTAGAASFSFSARERLVDRLNSRLDALLEDKGVDAEGAASLIRTLLNNVVRQPSENKFRTINLGNQRIAATIGRNAQCLAILRSVGFAKVGNDSMILGKDKRVINVAPLAVARDCIDKWIQQNRNEMAKAARIRQDEIHRAKLQAEGGVEEEEGEDEEELVDPDLCTLRLRLNGKNKVHQVELKGEDPLSSVLDLFDISVNDEGVEITCVAKRMRVKGSDEQNMRKSLRDHGLMPSASIVVNVGTPPAGDQEGSLKARATEKRKKKGSHTMQSVGIYSKDDNNKAELIDGGGGVWYEHDVSDAEETEEAGGHPEEPSEDDSSQD